jgi:hypothetical protein
VIIMRTFGLTALSLLLGSTACPSDDSGATSDGSDTGASSSTSDPTTTGVDPETTADPTTGDPPPTTTGEDSTGGTDSSGGEETTGPGLEGDVLQNDSFTPLDSLEFQTWPNMSDCWASVYEADMSQYPFDIVGAIVAIGGDASVETFEIAVWEVDNMSMPDTEIASMTVDIDGGTNDFAEIDLTSLGVPTVDNGEFAIVMCHTGHMGMPSIAIDADGTVDADRNWVFQAAAGEWVQSPDFFDIDGDFIMRAVIMPQG